MSWKLDKVEKSNGKTTQEFIAEMKVHAKRLLVLKGWTHSFTNMFVEACRSHAYHAGHIWMWQTVLMIAMILGLTMGVIYG